MFGLRSVVFAASAVGTSAKHHGLTMAQWATSNARVGPCPCNDGRQGTFAEDNACYDEAGTMCAPPAGPEYHPPEVDVPALVSGLAKVTSLVQNSETSLDFENGAVVGFIENRLNPGQCLDVKDGTDYLQMHSCEFDWDNKTTDQIWKFRPDGFIENVKYPGTCIDVIGNPATDFSRAQLHFCEFGWKLNDQQWVMTDKGFLRNRLTPSKCLDVRGQAQTQEDSDIIMYECDALFTSHPELKVTDQTWKLFSVVPTSVPVAPVVVPSTGTSPSVGPADESVAVPTDKPAASNPGAVFPTPFTGPTGPADGSSVPAPAGEVSSEPAGDNSVPAPASGSETNSETNPSQTSGEASSEPAAGNSVPAPAGEASSEPADGNSVPAAAGEASSAPADGNLVPVPASGSHQSTETIHGQEALADTDGESPTYCLCADASTGILDGTLLCRKNGEICSGKTSASVGQERSSLWPYAALVVVMLGFLIIGGVVYSRNQSFFPKKTRDLDLSPGARTSSDIELLSDEEAPPASIFACNGVFRNKRYGVI